MLVVMRKKESRCHVDVYDFLCLTLILGRHQTLWYFENSHMTKSKRRHSYNKFDDKCKKQRYSRLYLKHYKIKLLVLAAT